MEGKDPSVYLWSAAAFRDLTGVKKALKCGEKENQRGYHHQENLKEHCQEFGKLERKAGWLKCWRFINCESCVFLGTSVLGLQQCFACAIVVFDVVAHLCGSGLL